MASISICMSAYRRGPQLDRTLESIAMQIRFPHQIVIVEDGNDDNGATREVCERWAAKLPIHYCQRLDRPKVSWSNPAIPKNISIKQAIGDILVIQCPEIRFLLPTDLGDLVKPVEENPAVTSYARYCGVYNAVWTDGKPPFVEYCQAIRREHVLAIGGFEESFKGFGFEDGDFQYRIQNVLKLKQMWAPNVLVQHQDHERFEGGKASELLEDKSRASYLYAITKCGFRTSANIGREWGILKNEGECHEERRTEIACAGSEPEATSEAQAELSSKTPATEGPEQCEKLTS